MQSTRRQVHKAIVLLALLTLPAAAQPVTVTTTAGSLTASGAEVTVAMPHRVTVASRDLLALASALPRAGAYQHVADDVALILDAAQWEGQAVPAFPPLMAADTLQALLDSLGAVLQAAAGQGLAEIARRDSVIRAQSATLQAQEAALSGMRERLAAAEAREAKAAAEAVRLKTWVEEVRALVGAWVGMLSKVPR